MEQKIVAICLSATAAVLSIFMVVRQIIVMVRDAKIYAEQKKRIDHVYEEVKNTEIYIKRLLERKDESGDSQSGNDDLRDNNNQVS